MAESIVDADLLNRGGVELTIQGRRATISLNRPEKLNAQTPATWEALRAIGQGLDPDIRVVVVRGAGRAAIASSVPSWETRSPAESLVSMAFSWLREPDRVTIAAVHGHAIGAGFQLALACDMRVLAQDARFRMAETSLGLVPDLGGTLPLVRAVGYAKAVEICVTGREVPADEALQLGLANAVVPVEGLDAAVDQLVESVLKPPAGAVRETLALLVQADEQVDPEQQLAEERSAQLRRIAELLKSQ